MLHPGFCSDIQARYAVAIILTEHALVPISSGMDSTEAQRPRPPPRGSQAAPCLVASCLPV